MLAASRYDHPEVSQLVTLTAGQVFDAGDIVLGYQTRPPLTAEGSLIIRTVDSFGAALTGATVQLIDVGGTIATQSRTMTDSESSVSFTAVPIGTYTVRVTKANYRPGTINQLTIGLGPVERQLTMLQYGTARGTVIDAVAGYTTVDPIYVTDADPDTAIVFDPGNPVLLPPESQVGPNAVAAFRTTAPAPGGQLVVQYSNGTLFYDANDDGVPESLLTLLRVGARPLSGYELLLYRLDGTNPVCIGPIAASGDEWEIDPSMQLLSGSYALRFGPLGAEVGTACAARGRLPDGYAAIPADANGNVATFTVADNLDQKILVAPVRVAPYPRIAGRVLVPRVDGGAIVFDDFAAADASGLAVVLDCGAAGSVDAEVAAAGTQIAFTVSREQLQAIFPGVTYDATTGDLASCTLRTRYENDDRFIPVEQTIALRMGLAPPDYQDHYVSVALVDDPGIIVGTVQWRDLGEDAAQETYPVPFATVSSGIDPADPADDEVIVGFTPTDEADPSDPDAAPASGGDPNDQTAAVSTEADGGGTFAFAVPGQRQVFGTSGYTVSGTPFGTQPVRIEVVAGDQDEAADWTAADPTTPAPVPPAVIDNGNSVDVFLQPDPGTLSGTVEIVSHRDTRAALVDGGLTVTGTPPGGTPAPFTLTDGGPDRVAFTTGPGAAAAGTWSIDAEVNPGSNLHLRSTDQTTALVMPAQSATPKDPFSAVELGQIDVTLKSSPDTAITASDVFVELTKDAGPLTVPDTFDDQTERPDSNGELSFGQLPVGDGSPLTDEIVYRVSATVPFHDVPTSQVKIVRLNPTAATGPTDVRPVGEGITNIEVVLRAGERVRIDMIVPAYGTITGNLRGQVTPPDPDVDAAYEALVAGQGGARVAAHYLDKDGVEQSIALEPVGVGGDFSMRVPAGNYWLVFSAPGYVSKVGVPFLLVPEGTYTENATLLLQTRPYQLTARNGVGASADDVAGASVDLQWGAYDPSHAPPGDVTDDDGVWELPGAYPGTYTLVVRKRVGTEDVNFPVIATVTIPRVLPDDNGDPTISHTIAMPAVGGSIEVKVKAIAESTERPLALPSNLSVSRTYALGQLGGPGILPNTATEGDLVPQPETEILLTEATAGAGTSYDFDHLAYGDHVLTFGTADGYDLTPDTNPVTVPVAGDTAYEVVYSAPNVAVEVAVTDSVTGDPVENATVTLVPTAPGQDDPGSPTAAGGTYTFDSVPPDLLPYTLHIEAVGYAVRPDTPLTVEPSSTAQTEPVTLTPVATITGTARTQGQTLALYSGPVQLLDGDGDVVDTMTPAADGVFRFEREEDELGSFSVRIAPTGHEPVEVEVNGGAAIQLRQTYSVEGLTALAHATASITAAVTGTVPGLRLDVTPHVGVSGDGASSAGEWTVTGLKPTVTYSFVVTATNHNATPIADYTATPGGTYTASSTLTGKPARATISVANTPVPAGLALAVSPSDGVVGAGPSSDGTWNVTGLVPGTPYTYTITSTNFQNAVLTDTPNPNGNYTPDPVTLTGKPATAAIAVTNTPVPAGLSLGISPTGPSGGGASTDGDWSVTGLTAGQQYTFTITATGFVQQQWTYTPGPNEAYAPAAVTLLALPRATISVNGAPIAGLALAVSPAHGTVSGPTAEGVFSVTGLTPGQHYAFTLTSTNYEDYTIPGGWDATAGNVFAPTAITLTPKPATASITVAGGAQAVAGVTVNCSDSSIVGDRVGNTWTFSLPSAGSYTFTVPAVTGFQSATSSTYVWQPNGTFSETLTPAAAP